MDKSSPNINVTGLAAMASSIEFIDNHNQWIIKKFQQIWHGANNAGDVVDGKGWKYWLLRLLVDRRLFYLCSLLIILVYLITRLPFFIHYPIVGIQYDTETYMDQVSLIQSGHLPLFVTRPPGYILFVWLITIISDRWMLVVGLQSSLFLIANLCLIYGVYSLCRSLVLPATIAMAGFLGSSHVLIYETAALSDSLYTSCLIFIFAFLLLGFGQRQTRYFILSSVFIGISISVRSAGLFMLIIYVVILLYMFLNKYQQRLILGFLSPLLLLLFCWSAYNYFTLGSFSISAQTSLNMASATVWFWEPDQSFPPAVNDVLHELPSDMRQIGITRADQVILRESWDPEQLESIFYKLYAPMYLKGWGHDKFVNVSGNASAGSIVGNIMIKSIEKHPDLYAKFVWTNLIYYYKDLELGKQIGEFGRIDFYSFLSSLCMNFYTNANGGLYHDPALNGEISKEYFNKQFLDFAYVSGSGNNIGIILKDSSLKSYI